LVHFIVSLGSRRMWDAASKLIREFRDEVVVDAVFQWTQDDYGSSVGHFNLLN